MAVANCRNTICGLDSRTHEQLHAYHGFEGVKRERGDSVRMARELVQRRKAAKVVYVCLEQQKD